MLTTVAVIGGDLLALVPALDDRLRHAQRRKRLAAIYVAERRVVVGAQLGSRALLRRPGGDVIADGEAEQYQGAADGDEAERRMQLPDEGNEDDGPGRIEQGERTVAVEEGAQVGHIARSGFEAGAGKPGFHRAADHRAGELEIEPGAGTGEHQPPGMLDEAVDDDGGERAEGQPDQRIERVGRQHAIVDLQHVEHGDEQQQVDEATEQDKRRKLVPDAIDDGFVEGLGHGYRLGKERAAKDAGRGLPGRLRLVAARR
ncbi:MAG: hypothetical protein K0Q69_4239 [Devosia sp.]|nr:hypothetical protein [Devosia sp.]